MAQRSPQGLPVLPLVPFACMPSLYPGRSGGTYSLVLSHQRRPSLDRRRVASRFRGLLSVHVRYGLHARQVTKVTLYTRWLRGFVASTAAPIAAQWNEPVLGRTFTRSGPALFTAHDEHRLGRGLGPPSCRACSAHQEKARSTGERAWLLSRYEITGLDRRLCRSGRQTICWPRCWLGLRSRS